MENPKNTFTSETGFCCTEAQSLAILFKALPLVAGLYNPLNNLWTDSSEALAKSEQFAQDVLKHIATRSPMAGKDKHGLTQ